MTSWCTLARSKHLFGTRTVTLSSDSNEKEIWANHLEIIGDDFTHLLTLLDPRVWVGHFHYQDYIVIGDDEGNASFKEIDFKSITKYREYDTGRSSLTRLLDQQLQKIAFYFLILVTAEDCHFLNFVFRMLLLIVVDVVKGMSKCRKYLQHHHHLRQSGEDFLHHFLNSLWECLKTSLVLCERQTRMDKHVKAPYTSVAAK